MRPYYHRDSDSLIEPAMRDHDAYLVERIIKHKGNTSRKKSLAFLVKWIGYEEPTWNDYMSLKTNIKLHDYLRSNRLESLIPNNIVNN